MKTMTLDDNGCTLSIRNDGAELGIDIEINQPDNTPSVWLTPDDALTIGSAMIAWALSNRDKKRHVNVVGGLT